MTPPPPPPPPSPLPPAYDDIFARFDSPLMQRVRAMAYGEGEEIGQHSWVTASELRADAVRLSLGDGTRLLDLGCGACGPLVLLAREYHCEAFGLDASSSALASGARRADSASVALSLRAHDLTQPLPFADATFDAVISTDVVLHLPDRRSLMREVRRILRPGGRFLFTDAGVVTGVISSDEIARRSGVSTNYLAPAGYSEECLTSAGLALREWEDRTAAVASVARGRLAAYNAYREQLLDLLGDAALVRDELYLSTVALLAERRALSRFMYCAERLAS